MENITIEIDDIDQTSSNYSTTGIPNSASDGLFNIILNVLHVIISGLTIFFNLSIFSVILSRPKLRNWNNFYLCGMFLAAIGTAMANIIHKLFLEIDQVILFQQGFIAVFNYLIAVVTFNRFLRLYKPIRCKNIMTKAVIVSVTISSYLFCFIVPSVDFILRHLLTKPIDNSLIRMLNWLLVCHIYILPCICTIFLYIRIVMIVFSRVRFLNQVSLYHAKQSRSNMKSFQQLALIVTLYILCWLPYCISYLILPYPTAQNADTMNIVDILVLLIFFHQAINPMLYVLLTTTIKDEVVIIAFHLIGRRRWLNRKRKTVTSSYKGETFSTTANFELHPQRCHDVGEVTFF